ncbi:hypothetical protein O181_065998 [Austropuccinia psidii MF-1]|uniref:Uncharacterized protein n=1 Tax=Austropuccinia psidii MF-1 TaxID=1389203 RepID=A0A9Q3I357_9BASI|nr:hypothetical protein [Austropuccinia psidii MF-1]
MTPTRSGRNHSIQLNVSGPGHSGHKFKRQECQSRGETKKEDSRASTSSQRLARAFETLIEGPEADITPILIVRPEQFPTVNKRDIQVSVQELAYCSKVAGVKDRGPSEGLDTSVLQRTSPTDKSLAENQSTLTEDRKKKLAQGKDNSLVEAPQASTSAKIGQEISKEKSEGQEKGKGKGKI